MRGGYPVAPSVSIPVDPFIGGVSAHAQQIKSGLRDSDIGRVEVIQWLVIGQLGVCSSCSYWKQTRGKIEPWKNERYRLQCRLVCSQCCNQWLQLLFTFLRCASFAPHGPRLLFKFVPLICMLKGHSPEKGYTNKNGMHAIHVK